MKNKIFLLAVLMYPLGASAQLLSEVRELNLTGPYIVSQPAAGDSVDVNGRKFDVKSLLSALPVTSQAETTVWRTGRLSKLFPSKAKSGQHAVGMLSFYVNNDSYVKGKLSVKGLKHYDMFVDGLKVDGGELKLAPEHHTVNIRYMAEASDSDTVSVMFDGNRQLVTSLSQRHPYMVHDLTDGRRVRGIALSADGAYVTVSYQTTERGGKSRWEYELKQTKDGRLVRMLTQNVRWMPRSSAYIEEVWEADKRMLYKVTAATGERNLLARNLPKGSYTISPTEDYLILTAEEEGPKEDADIFQVLEMDDRQAGWRSRSYLMYYDLATGLCQRITFGHRGQYLCDISRDGSTLLVGAVRSRLQKRPTSVSDYVLMDVRTLKTDSLLTDAEFLGNACFSPDGKQILFTGNPEAFGRVGCQLPANVTPSAIENELFLYDIATQKVTPLTRDFDPSVNSVHWTCSDGMVYFSAEDRDYVRLYQMNPTTGHIQMLDIQGDNAFRFDVADGAQVMAYLSYETMAPASAWVAHTKKGKGDLKQIRLFDGHSVIADAELGTCQDWDFINSRGDKVYGRLYLPKDFDATRKYPMIVYYYGGCSPVSRYFESPYAPQYWNSLGYVAYIVQPSGATGFGQEWASRHVNTAGHGPAEDIIEGTKRICDEHPFIDRTKVGCMGASYGGFMTQYLQTQTDIFAAAVSHAGIANHTSYWGEGYWGYNYSEVSMANSYPWSHRQLFVDQSPLFNADKIHTPLLLLHGTDDTNVPIVESLQMFTALKLLGREVALVEVKGQNHHITDYVKREKWLATQMAWFQKWLKDDSSWWDALYPKKNL